MADFDQGIFIEISADIKDVVAKLKQLNETVMQTLQEIKINVDVNSAEKAQNVLGKLQGSAQDATSATQYFGESLKSIGSQLTNAANGYINAVKSMFDKIKGIAIAGAFSIGAALRSAFNVGGGFESSMTAVKVISGATAEEFTQLTAKARELGATLPITARDAANAMTIMAQRGTSVKNILATVNDVTNLAISQNISMADAADMLGSTMTNFGIAMEDASRVTDIFNNASNQSALTMAKLQTALRYVAPMANAAGMAFEQAMAAMEVLANSGFDGSMIGTGLSMTISRLAKNTEVLGVKTQDAQGNLRSLSEIFLELKQRGVNLSEMTGVFGERAAKMALALVKSADSLDTFEQRLKSIGSTQGSVQQQMGTWRNTVASLSSAIESVRLTVFDQLKDKAKTTVNSITEMARAFDEWLTKTDAASKILEAFLKGFDLGLPSLGAFKQALKDFNLDSFLEKITSIGTATRQVVEIIETFASVAFRAFNIVYTIIGAHSGVIGEFIKNFLAISYAVKIVGTAISGAGGLIVGLAKLAGVLGTVGTALVSVGEYFLAATGIVGTFSAGITALVGGGAIAALVAAFAALGYAVKKTFDASEELDEALRRERKVNIELYNVERSVEWLQYLKAELKTGFEKVDLSGIIDERVLKSTEKYIENLQKVTFEKVTESAELFNTALSKTESSLGVTEKALADFKPLLQKYFETGDVKIFDDLPEQFKIVLRIMEADTFSAKLEILNELRSMSKEAWNTLDGLSDGVKIKIDMTPIEEFTERATEGVQAILDSLKARLSKSFEILGDTEEYKISVEADTGDAIEAINELAKALGEKLGIGTTAARLQIENMMQSVAASGDKTAELLTKSFDRSKKATEEMAKKCQDLSTKFSDFVQYMGASPAKFLPALKQMLANVQAIDPATGRVTEAFKKAYAAVKEFANLTLGNIKSQIESVASAVKKGFIDEDALGKYQDQYKINLYANMQSNFDWEAFGGRESKQAMAVFVSQFMDALKDIDTAASNTLHLHFFELTKLWGQSNEEASARVYKDLEQEMAALAGSNPVKAQLEQEVKLPDMASLTQSFAQYSQQQTGFMQQSQQNASQIASTGQALVSAMTDLKRAVELNTASQGTGGGGASVSVDTSRLEAICNSIMTVISGVQTDVQEHSTLLASISNSIAKSSGDTVNNYNYDVDINQTGFTVQSKGDADSLARSVASAFRNGLGFATA